MPGYLTRQLTLRFGDHDYRIRALRDLRQFADPFGDAARAGISSALWSLFGHVWASGRVLAETMCAFEVQGKRILEIGCGLGLSSLVLQRRGADIVASDHHPLAESFLAYNAALNGLPLLAYRNLAWAAADVSLGRFDLIIGSDVLYEREHAGLLSALMQRHARPECEVLIADSGRGNGNALSHALGLQGYSVNEDRRRFDESDVPPFRGRLLSYRR